MKAVDKAAEQTTISAPDGGPTLYEAVMLGLPPATAADRNGFDLKTRPGTQAVSPAHTHGSSARMAAIDSTQLLTQHRRDLLSRPMSSVGTHGASER